MECSPNENTLTISFTNIHYLCNECFFIDYSLKIPARYTGEMQKAEI